MLQTHSESPRNKNLTVMSRNFSNKGNFSKFLKAHEESFDESQDENAKSSIRSRF